MRNVKTPGRVKRHLEVPILHLKSPDIDWPTTLSRSLQANALALNTAALKWWKNGLFEHARHLQGTLRFRCLAGWLSSAGPNILNLKCYG